MLKINLQKDQELWITSDTHFGHSNLVKGITKWRDKKTGAIPPNVRDYNTLDEMNAAIVDNINSCVKEDDLLLCLGDWAFGGFDNIRIFRNRLLCKNIHLITGNHDHHIVKNKDNIRSIFSTVTEFYTQISISQPDKESIDLIACHFPLASWENMSKGWIQIFGHVHLPPHQRIMGGRAMDVGMDGNEMYPLRLQEVLSLMKNQPKKPLVLPSDHHADTWVEVKK